MANAKFKLDSRSIRNFLKSEEVMKGLMDIGTDLKSDIEVADKSGANWIAEEHERPSRATVVIVPEGRDDEDAVAAKWQEVETGDIAKTLKRKQQRIKKYKKGQSE